jgi:hypothetical protein
VAGGRSDYRWRVIRALGAVIVALVATSIAVTPAIAAPCATGEGRSLVLLSARTGAIEQSYPGISGVNVVLADGHGGWFVGGSISCFAGLHSAGVIHLGRAGGIDRRWHAPPGLPVSALARSGPTLYAAGAFGVEALGVADGARRWITRVQGGVLPGVLALAAGPTAVYLGGGFAAVARHRLASLAALDPRTGALLAWRAPVLDGFGAASVVGALALDGSRLFAGGDSIVSVDGQKRPGFAELDATTGAVLPWLPATAPGVAPGYGVGDVETILVAHGEVFSAGHDGYGITDEATGSISPLMRDVREAFRFAAAGHTAYVAGNNRNTLRLRGAARDNLAAVDLATGRITPWAPRIDRYVDVASIAASASRVLVAGSFTKSLG